MRGSGDGRRRSIAAPALRRERAAARRAPLERVVIRDGAQVHVVPVDTHRLRRSAGRLRRVPVRRASTLLKEQTLADLEAQLDPRRFVRIHRSYLLNIERLARVELYAKDSRVAILHGRQRSCRSAGPGYQRLQQLL